MNCHGNKKRGFTLIELLVVIAIIGLLSSIVLASLNSARKKSRDARRIADLKQLQTALELYYSDHEAYPVLATQNTTNSGFATALNGLITGGYIGTIPSDPGSSAYYYKSTSDGGFYCLGAVMEGTAPSSTCNTTSLGSSLTTANYATGP